MVLIMSSHSLLQGSRGQDRGSCQQGSGHVSSLGGGSGQQLHVQLHVERQHGRGPQRQKTVRGQVILLRGEHLVGSAQVS